MSGWGGGGGGGVNVSLHRTRTQAYLNIMACSIILSSEKRLINRGGGTGTGVGGGGGGGAGPTNKSRKPDVVRREWTGDE